jgi:hypothetical protein
MKTGMALCLAAIMLSAVPVLAAEDININAPVMDEFGSNFTANAPEALREDPLPMEMSAEDLNNVAPAAGESATPDAGQGSDILPVPDTVPVPGMEQTGPASASPLTDPSQE